MNNQLRFDPMTGQPLTYNNNSSVQNQNIGQTQVVQPQVNNQPIPQNIPVQQATAMPTINNNTMVQQQMQAIPTVDQNRQAFMNNTQANNTVKSEKKKEGSNITFIVVLFIIMFAAIFFLFPYLFSIL